MAINNIWVFAQDSNGVPTTATLELLTKARSLSGSVSAFVEGDASGIAAALGEYGAAKVYSTGDLGGALPGVAVSAAMKAVIDGGDSPDLIMFPQNYEGRDIMSRLSVQLDRTVITNNVDIANDGDSVKVTTPIFGGNTLVKVGSLILFLGLAFLLRYAANHISVPIEMRYTGVAASALALLVFGWKLRHRRRDYALILQGLAVAVLYLTIYAAMKLHPLLPSTLGFVLMFIVPAVQVVSR